MSSSFKNLTIDDTGFFKLPVGTTGQRPTASAGMLRYNSTNGALEAYNGGITSWENTAISWTTPAGSLGVIGDRNVPSYTTTYTLSAAGPGTITYSIVKGSMPPGMSLNTSTGVISGDPIDLAVSQGGAPVLNYPFTVRATSSLGGYRDRSFAITMSGGGGRGKPISEGGEANAVNGFIAGNQPYWIDSWYGSAGAGGTLFTTTYSGGSFAYHTGHNANSTQWPFHIVVKATSTPGGKVLNRIQWIKHSNAIGNCNIWGSNFEITQNTYNDTNLYTFLGRVHMGGFGSAGDGTVMVDYFNPDNLGFKWYMVQCMDISSQRLPYPYYTTWQGWAMFGLTLDKV